MANDVSICNAALMALGDSPIASLAENSKRAILCNALYPTVRDEMLRAHNWNCLITRVVLSPLGDAPAFGWEKQFTKPGDWLRTLSVGDDLTGYEDYAFEGNRIYANTDTLKLRYVAAKDPGEWDAHLVALVTKRMEVALAYPITKSTSLRESLKQDFYAPRVGVLAQAKAVDGQENPPEDYGDSPFIAVRSGGRTYG